MANVNCAGARKNCSCMLFRLPTNGRKRKYASAGNVLGRWAGTLPVDANHLRSLNNCMWSSVLAMKVVAWRMLNALIEEGWPKDLLEIFYIDEDMPDWGEGDGPSDRRRDGERGCP